MATPEIMRHDRYELVDLPKDFEGMDLRDISRFRDKNYFPKYISWLNSLFRKRGLVALEIPQSGKSWIFEYKWELSPYFRKKDCPRWDLNKILGGGSGIDFGSDTKE